MQIPW